jgi:hypothetical protein
LLVRQSDRGQRRVHPGLGDRRARHLRAVLTAAVEVLLLDGLHLRVSGMEAVDHTLIVDVKPVLLGRRGRRPASAAGT